MDRKDGLGAIPGAITVFDLNKRKAIQAVAYLMGQKGIDADAYLKLIKLLYVAERECLIETGCPLTGDRACAMPHGPALSVIADAIGKEQVAEDWSEYFAPAENHRLALKRDPGVSALSRYEMAKLAAVARRFQGKDRWATRDETHYLPEWVKHEAGRSSETIPVSDILEAGNASEKLRAATRRGREDRAFVQALGRRQ